MRIILIIALMTGGCIAAEVTKTDPVYTGTTSPYLVSSADIPTLWQPSKINFWVNGGCIEIDLKTGNVTIPKGVSVDEASKEFWLALAKSYPDIARAMLRKAITEMIESDNKQPNTAKP